MSPSGVDAASGHPSLVVAEFCANQGDTAASSTYTIEHFSLLCDALSHRSKAFLRALSMLISATDMPNEDGDTAKALCGPRRR